jgi:subtilase family serine protease
MPARSRSARLVLPAALAIALSGAVASYAGGPQTAPATTAMTYRDVHACDRVPAGWVSCSAIRRDVSADGKKPRSGGTTSAPAGYGPTALQGAYAVPATSTTATVAIVDAYDDPSAESDLAKYRSTYGLPPCTTSNGCLRKVNQTGGTSMPSASTGWSQEIALDLDMVSAICPSCHILLVEATSATVGNLSTAVQTAAKLGAVAISNSYGGNEFSGETSYDAAYNQPGIAVTVSSGDSGYGVQYPAASPYVIAVGGTSLKSQGGGWTESAWSGAGSGCSAYESKPSWQKDTGCTRRTVADVSAVADPNTGVAVYDSYGQSGWLVFGGTSVASPIVASMYAIAGNHVSTASSAYSHVSSLRDVVSGSNGNCAPSYLCTAVTGYDGPTVLGTPQGVGAL